MCHAVNMSKPAVVQVDFSEYFTADMQDGEQNAHWNKKQFTIFTAVLWVGTDTPQSYAIISDNLQHDKYAVCAYRSKILNEMQIRGLGRFYCIHVFSDGAASQFKKQVDLHVQGASYPFSEG